MKPAVRRGAAVGFFLIVVANLLGGGSYPVQKLALEGLPPATIALARTLVGLALLAIWTWHRGFRLAAYSRGERLRLLFLGTGAFALPLLLGVIGVERASAANASILILLEPVTIVAFAWLLLGDRVGPLKLVGIGAGLAGALLIVVSGVSVAELFAGDHATGNLILVVHAILWGLYTPIAKPLTERHDAIELTMLTLAAALILLVPAAAGEWNEWSLDGAALVAFGWCAALGVFVSLLGTLLWLAALGRLRASTIAPFIFLQPFVGVLVGTLFLEEVLTRAAIGGGALIVVGVVLSMKREATAPAAE